MRKRRARVAGLVVVLSSASLVPQATARAQGSAQAGTDTAVLAPGTSSAAGGDTGSSRGAGSQGGTGSPSGTVFFPGGVAPTAPGQTLGGGNVSSSANKPRTGGEQDSFDLNRSEGGGGTGRGSADGPIFMQNGGMTAPLRSSAPDVHVVKKGDTLWGICESYFQNPYHWPRIWSYNPQIQNPHYIEVGQAVRLRSDKDGRPATSTGTSTGFKLQDDRGRVVPETIFLREEGFIEDEETDTLGELTGAPEDKMFLSDTDDVYLRILPKRSARIGQEFTLFRPLRSVGKGQVIQLLGTVRVNQYDAKEHLARATVVETLDVIERGVRVGAIPRRFEVVAPVRNQKDVTARVLTSVQRHNFYGQYQVVYVDKGSEDGLVPGNTLRVTRKGDGWRESLPNDSAARRIDMESDAPAAIEAIPRPRDEKSYPEEVVGELRVVSVRKHTAMCVVTQSWREIEINEVARARKGY